MLNSNTFHLVWQNSGTPASLCRNHSQWWANLPKYFNPRPRCRLFHHCKIRHSYNLIWHVCDFLKQFILVDLRNNVICVGDIVMSMSSKDAYIYSRKEFNILVVGCNYMIFFNWDKFKIHLEGNFSNVYECLHYSVRKNYILSFIMLFWSHIFWKLLSLGINYIPLLRDCYIDMKIEGWYNGR